MVLLEKWLQAPSSGVAILKNTECQFNSPVSFEPLFLSAVEASLHFSPLFLHYS